jgi:hypothetical protein
MTFRDESVYRHRKLGESVATDAPSVLHPAFCLKQ